MSCLQAAYPNQYHAGNNDPETRARLGDVEHASDQALRRHDDTELAHGRIHVIRVEVHHVRYSTGR